MSKARSMRGSGKVSKQKSVFPAAKYPPENFAMVEKGLYRSGPLYPLNISFLRCVYFHSRNGDRELLS